MSKRAAKSVPEQSQKRQKVNSQNNDYLLEEEDDVNESTVGKILSITLKNFMNHDNLKFDFSPHVNIIIGRNGSGKSAVVSGILLALGGKSNLTGRYSSLKGYVKNGKQTALLAVTLSNEGNSPYKQEIYGPKIIVERIITFDGSGSYKIKSHAGQIIATSKEELNKVLDCLKIQVDNPISILTQENSRSFLDSKSAKDKYKFFFKATQLEKLYETYMLTEHKRIDSQHLLKKSQEAVPEMVKDIEKWQKFLDTSDKIPAYENELVWSQVIEVEKKRDSVKKEYDASVMRVNSSEEKLKQSVENYDACCASLDVVKAKLAESFTDVNNLKKEIFDLETEMGNLHNEIRQKKGEVDKVGREIWNNAQEIESLQRGIDETIKKSQEDVKEEKRKREEKISKLKQEKQKLKNQCNDLSVKQKQLDEEINDKERKIQNLQIEERENMEQLTKVSSELQSLQNRVQDPKNRFGPYMLSLLNNIDTAANKGYFIKKPIGPIAQFVQVEVEKWRFAIEFLLGEALLRSFCCDNFEDKDKLTKMIQDYQPKDSRYQKQSHQVIVSKFLTKVHNVQEHKVRSHHPTVLDFIKCTNPVVMNCLIDQRSIESILLIENSNEAIDLMMNNPPRNCSSTYLRNGDQIYPKPKHRYYSCKKGSIFLLQSVQKGDIRKIQEQIDDLNLKGMEKKNKIKVVKEEVSDKKKSFCNINRELKDVHRKIQFCEEQIEDLIIVEDPKDVHLMQDDLEKHYEEKNCLEKRKEDLTHKFDIKTAEFKKHQEKMRIIKESYDTKSTIYGDCHKDKVELETNKENYCSEKVAYENAVQKERDKMNSIDRSYDQAKKDAEIWANNALKICPRIESIRSPQSIETLIAETKKMLETNSNCKSRTDVKKMHADKKKTLESSEANIKKLNDLIERLQKMVNIRFENYKEILRATQSLLQYDFIPLLQSNNYSGQIYFSHDKNTLNIQAVPSETSKSKRNTKDLSGGERSFVQICFLLSLWQCVEMPFRILDEYDVFMDSVNRQLSFDLILNTALKNFKTQHILFSPLELPRMEKSEMITIHHMPDPKRTGAS